MVCQATLITSIRKKKQQEKNSNIDKYHAILLCTLECRPRPARLNGRTAVVPTNHVNMVNTHNNDVDGQCARASERWVPFLRFY